MGDEWGVRRAFLYACVRLDLARRLGVATYHLASRQNNGRRHGEKCIFQQYGRVSEAQQRRRRQDALRRLERELDGEHTIGVCFAPIPKSGCMKAIRRGGIKSDVRYVTTAFSSARRWVNERKGGKFWERRDEDRDARLCLTLLTPNLWLGVALRRALNLNNSDNVVRIHKLSLWIIYIKRKILKPNKLIFRRGKLGVVPSKKRTFGTSVRGFNLAVILKVHA